MPQIMTDNSLSYDVTSSHKAKLREEPATASGKATKIYATKMYAELCQTSPRQVVGRKVDCRSGVQIK